MRYMSELIDAYEANPAGGALVALEQHLHWTGPLFYNGKAYGRSEPGPYRSIEVLGPLRRAEMVPVPDLVPLPA